MKIIPIALMVYSIALGAHAELNLKWQVDLSEYASTINAPRLRQYADGSVAVMLRSETPEQLVVFDSEGALKFADSYSGQGLYFEGHASNPDRILIQIYDNAYIFRLYEISGTNYLATNLTFKAVEEKSDAGIDSSILYAVDGDMLKKYQLSQSTNTLSGVVASGIDGSNFILNWDGKLGTEYQIQKSSSLTNWIDEGSSITGTGSAMTWANALTNSSSFFRVIEK